MASGSCDLAAPLVEGFDSLKKVFQDQQGKAERHLRMAAPATVLNSQLRHLIAAYRNTHPQVRLSLIDAPSRIAWQLMEAEKADLAIVGAPEGVPLPSRFQAVPLVAYPFEVVCLESHPFAKIKAPDCVTSSNNHSSWQAKTRARACSLTISWPKPA